MSVSNSSVVTRFAASACAELRVAVLPVPGFTMVALAGFLDALRLAADEGDRSRPIRCQWTVLTDRRSPVRASNGITVEATGGLTEPIDFHYVVVVGGVLHPGASEPEALLDYLRRADAAGVPLVGLCTGSLTLARAGLMEGRRACVSWFHHDDYLAEYPGHRIVSDRLFLDDGDRITSAGGVSVVHAASHLIERHCGPGAAAKGLRILMEEQARGETPQPAVFPLPISPAADPRVRRALLLMERQLAEPLRVPAIAAAVGLSPRQLTRAFQGEFNLTPAMAFSRLRLAVARKMMDQQRTTLSRIAAECGFSDGAHLSRTFRKAFGCTPSSHRISAQTALEPKRS